MGARAAMIESVVRLPIWTVSLETISKKKGCVC